MKQLTEVGKLGPGEMFNEGGIICFGDLSPEIQTIINNAEATEAKLKVAVEALKRIDVGPTSKEAEWYNADPWARAIIKEVLKNIDTK